MSHSHCCCKCHEDQSSRSKDVLPSQSDLNSLEAMIKETVDNSAVFERPKNFINVKSKRQRFIFKKAIELSQMCDLEVFIMIRDQAQEKLTTYCSGSPSKGNVFTIERAVRSLKEFDSLVGKSVKVFTDDDYSALDTSQYWKRYQEKRELNKKRGRPRKYPLKVENEVNELTLEEAVAVKEQKTENHLSEMENADNTVECVNDSSSGYKEAKPISLKLV